MSIIDVREAEAKIDTVAAQAIAAQADLELKHQLITELVGRATPELMNRGLAGGICRAQGDRCAGMDCRCANG
ncbi:hypothetical protein ACVBEH_14085 [Roseateles sp. GG27B]